MRLSTICIKRFDSVDISFIIHANIRLAIFYLFLFVAHFYHNTSIYN